MLSEAEITRNDTFMILFGGSGRIQFYKTDFKNYVFVIKFLEVKITQC